LFQITEKKRRRGAQKLWRNLLYDGGKRKKRRGKGREKEERGKKNFSMRSLFVFLRTCRSKKKREISGGTLQLFFVYVLRYRFREAHFNCLLFMFELIV
jgi:hypothetical protein